MEISILFGSVSMLFRNENDEVSSFSAVFARNKNFDASSVAGSVGGDWINENDDGFVETELPVLILVSSIKLNAEWERLSVVVDDGTFIPSKMSPTYNTYCCMVTHTGN